ncbi:hypothetical protein MUN84_04405 [Hymenobacter sp. 5516J-16]|uniref:HEAT repeat domain-containing protein n=1 Tax=Hymenobacter sublimis TaxID=2933777 RepID=A0ABY4J7I1_9BACT|nr:MULTISPECIES: hypothetical protein [Hymenobacter]UOQ77893.1 hypothetical protein MUN84_04405 [Hymenobacter sp. 5516J-16]UPL47877.1 hypothetical protein MWH26_11790 [Hymenobacter sublimis]
MSKKDRLTYLKSAVFSADRNEARNACYRLFHFGGRFHKTTQRRNRRFLLDLLVHENAQVRNAVAIVFRENRFNHAVIPLLKAIKNPANLQNRGTLVYALQALNCRKKLVELFEIVFEAAGNNWEVQQHVLTVLDEQSFVTTPAELRHIKQRWEDLRPSWNRINNITAGAPARYDLDDTLIQSFIDEHLTH